MTTLSVGSVLAADCVCREGSYMEVGACRMCPTGSICRIGSTFPETDKGYMLFKDEDDGVYGVYFCVLQDGRCPGGAWGRCASGRKGVTCGRCEDGKTPGGNGECKDCEGWMVVPP